MLKENSPQASSDQARAGPHVPVNLHFFNRNTNLYCSACMKLIVDLFKCLKIIIMMSTVPSLFFSGKIYD